VRHREEELLYMYTATISHTAAKRAALRDYVKVFFGGSRGEMLTTLLRQEAWTDDELDALRAEIDRVRSERKKP
jgi:predicted transcriptional regulator